MFQEELGLKPGDPAYLRLDRPFPLQTPSGGSPALTPYRSMPPAVETAQKKGLTSRGPLQKQTFPERGGRKQTSPRPKPISPVRRIPPSFASQGINPPGQLKDLPPSDDLGSSDARDGITCDQETGS